MRIIIVLLLLFSTPAFAQPYASISGGVTFVPTIDATSSGIPIGSEDTKTGFNVQGAAGYKWSGFRFEGEISFRRNDVDDAFDSGDISAFAFMANAWYDIDTGTRFTPYFGGGLGLARITADISTTAFGPELKIVNDTDTVFAWQGGAGGQFEVAPKVNIFAEYRYFATADPSFTAEPVFSSVPIDAEYSSHNIMAGVRMMF